MYQSMFKNSNHDSIILTTCKSKYHKSDLPLEPAIFSGLSIGNMLRARWPPSFYSWLSFSLALPFSTFIGTTRTLRNDRSQPFSKMRSLTIPVFRMYALGIMMKWRKWVNSTRKMLAACGLSL